MGLFNGLLKLFFGGAIKASNRIDVSKGAAAEGLPLIYGTRKVEAINVHKVVSQKYASAGSNRGDLYTSVRSTKNEEDRDNYDWLHRVDVFGQGPITQVVRYWIDGDTPLASRFSRRPYFRAMAYYGSDNQVYCDTLSKASSRWTSAHRGKGVAYAYTRFYNSKKKPQFTSDPRLEAEIKGLRVWDPRDPAQVHDDPDTWAHSDNRALVLLHYLMSRSGLHAPLVDIDRASFEIAADKCDEPMMIPAPSTYSGTEPREEIDRYEGDTILVNPGERAPNHRPSQGATETTQRRWTCDAVLDPKRSVIDNAKTLLEGMGWSLTWSNGKHKLILEDAVDTPVADYAEDDLLGGWTISRGLRDKRYNRVTIEFPNANKDYENDTVSWPSLDSEQYEEYLEQDGGEELHTTIKADTITDFYRARAYAKYLVQKSRIALVIDSVKLAPRAMLHEPGDVITITHENQGFNQRWFIVDKVSISPDLDVTLKLSDYNSVIYGYNDPDEEPIFWSGGNPDLRDEPPAVSNLRLDEVHEINYSGVTLSSILVTWDAPVGVAGLEEVTVQWKRSTDPDYINTQRLPDDATATVISNLVDDREYDVQVFYKNRLGVESVYAAERINLAAQEGQTIVIVGEGEPKSDVGQNGWRYIDMAEGGGFGTVWQKSNGEWTNTGNNIKGGDGDRWHSGADNPNDVEVSGATAGDFYMRDNGDVFQLLPSGAWDFRTNVQGPQGQPLYLWIGYAPNANGRGMTTGNPRSTDRYFGTAPNQTSPTEIADPSLYTWKEMPAGMTEQEIVDALGWDQNAVDTDHIMDDATSEIEIGPGNSKSSVSFASGGTQNLFLSKVSVKRDPRGILVYGIVALRTLDDSKKDLWLKVHRNGGPTEVGAANLVKISVDPYWRNQSLFFLDKNFAASGSTVEYQLWLGWGGNNVTFQVGQPTSISAWVQKK